jgi:hypothetical protein
MFHDFIFNSVDNDEVGQKENSLLDFKMVGMFVV